MSEVNNNLAKDFDAVFVDVQVTFDNYLKLRPAQSNRAYDNRKNIS